jgi:hypothetical protein
MDAVIESHRISQNSGSSINITNKHVHRARITARTTGSPWMAFADLQPASRPDFVKCRIAKQVQQIDRSDLWSFSHELFLRLDDHVILDRLYQHYCGNCCRADDFSDSQKLSLHLTAFQESHVFAGRLSDLVCHSGRIDIWTRHQ